MFRAGLGGRLGSGRQWFSWIHVEDLFAAMLHLLGRPQSAGAYNFGPAPQEAATVGRVIEMALAHVDQNETRAAYNRAEYWPQRVEMMQRWADLLDRVA